MLSKKYIKLVAEALKDSKANVDSILRTETNSEVKLNVAMYAIKVVQHRLEYDLLVDNPKFDFEKFRKAAE